MKQLRLIFFLLFGMILITNNILNANDLIIDNNEKEENREMKKVKSESTQVKSEEMEVKKEKNMNKTNKMIKEKESKKVIIVQGTGVITTEFIGPYKSFLIKTRNKKYFFINNINKFKKYKKVGLHVSFKGVIINNSIWKSQHQKINLLSIKVFKNNITDNKFPHGKEIKGPGVIIIEWIGPYETYLMKNKTGYTYFILNIKEFKEIQKAGLEVEYTAKIVKTKTWRSKYPMIKIEKVINVSKPKMN